MKFKKSLLLMFSLLVLIFCIGIVSAAQRVNQTPISTQGRNTVNITIRSQGEDQAESIGGLTQSAADGFNVSINGTYNPVQMDINPTCVGTRTQYYTKIVLNNSNSSHSYNISHILFELPDRGIENITLTDIRLQADNGNGSSSSIEFPAVSWSDCGTSDNAHVATCVNFTGYNGLDLNITVNASRFTTLQ